MLLAVWLVTSLPTTMVRVLVLLGILYTSFAMLRSAATERRSVVRPDQAADTGPGAPSR